MDYNPVCGILKNCNSTDLDGKIIFFDLIKDCKETFSNKC